MELAGKTALLTGATGGLGRAIAVALADRGATVLASSRKPEQLDELIAGLPGDGHRPIVADLADDGAALALLAEAGDIDVLVANAGLPASGPLDGFSQEEVGRALRVNLESPVRMARELFPKLVERGEGHLVFVSSISGQASTPNASLYAATKFGLRGFALCLREDLRKTGVGVSVDLAGRGPRRRHVRRQRREAATGPGHGDPRTGLRGGYRRHRAQPPGGVHRRSSSPARPRQGRHGAPRDLRRGSRAARPPRWPPRSPGARPTSGRASSRSGDGSRTADREYWRHEQRQLRSTR